MSISQINKVFQNKGCNIAMSTILGIAVIFSLGGFLRGCGQDPQQGQGGERDVPIVEAGGLTFTQSEYDRMVASQEQQFGGAGFPEAFATIQIGGSILQQNVRDGLTLKLVRDEGMDVSLDKAKQVLLKQYQDAQMNQLTSNGALRPGATQQEFESAFKAKSGTAWIDVRKQFEKAVDDKVKEPHGEEIVEAAAAAPIWVNQNLSKYMPSDEKVKEANQTITFKEIGVTPQIAGKTKPEDKAKQIEAEIKGGLSFEGAMDKYLPKPTEKGKKASDENRDLLVSRVESDPSLKPLLDLKPGQVSSVILDFGTPSLFKIVKKGLPENFEAQKTMLKEAMARNEALKALDEKVKKLDTPDNVKWHDEAYHLLYEYFPLANPSGAPVQDRDKKLQDIIDRAMAVGAKGTPRVAMIVAKGALDALAFTLPPDKANELKAKVLPEYLTVNSELSTKIELAAVYVDMGKAEDAKNAIDQAASAAEVNLDDSGKASWGQLNGVIEQAKKKKLITEEDAARYAASFKTWKQSYDQVLEDQKQAKEADKKRDEELSKAGQQPVDAGKDETKPAGDGKPEDKSTDNKKTDDKKSGNP